MVCRFLSVFIFCNLIITVQFLFGFNSFFLSYAMGLPYSQEGVREEG